MPASSEISTRAVWVLSLSAAAIMMITTGARQTTGLFISPINTATGLGIVSISFALAIGQFVWGASQPIFGAIADKFGSAKVIIAGTVMLAAGTALTPFVDTQLGLIMTMGVLAAAGAGAGSFSILIGDTARQLPPERRSFAAGFINAGGSFGQFVFAPFMQAVINTAGWVAAMLTLAATTLLTMPLTWALRRPRETAATHAAGVAHASAEASRVARPLPDAAPAVLGLREQLKIAIRDPSYLYLHAGFFTCGFHVAFLVTHLPGEVALCHLPATVSAMSIALIGLFNIIGSLGAGMLGSRYRMKNLLALIYASRAAMILLYLLAPKTPLTFYVFAAGLGLTWLSTVPPTAGIVGKLFGMRYLATLFGLTLLSHQTGAFFGAWLGGISVATLGDYTWMWYADIALALFAAVINLPIREAPVARGPTRQAPA